MRIFTPGYVLCALMSTTAAAQVANQTLQINKDNRTLAVTATDTASAFADVAVLHVGFEAYGADEQSAYAAGSQRSNAVVTALTAAGVPKDQIESQNQNLSPLSEYELRNQAAALKGMRFRLQQSWEVHTRPDDAAKLLDVAVKAGANQSGNIDWQVKDASVLESQAASKALAHAQSIAAGMAEGLHTHLGTLLYASNQAQESRPMPLAMRSMAAVEQKAAAPLAITNRKVERSATVYAIFSLQ